MKKTFSEILSHLDEVTEEPNGYVALCPAHEDSNPSLRLALNTDNGKLLITCRSGCEKPAVLKALNLTEADLFDVKPGDAVKTTRTEAADVGPGDIAALAMYLDKAAMTTAADPARDYAARRFGIDAAAFLRLGLGFDDGTLPAGKLGLSRDLYHDLPRLVVPFPRFDGTPHYLQARALSGAPKAKWSGPVNPEGAAWGKYGFLRGETGWADVIITEGPGDALTAVGVGYDALAIRGSGLASSSRLMDEIAQGLTGRRVVVAGDADKAGETFTAAICKALSERGLSPHRLLLPEGAKDVTAWRETVGASAFPKAFATAVVNASPYGADQITAESILQDVTRLFSDVYNARALLAQIREDGADLRFTPALGFLVYHEARGIWEVDSTEWVRRQGHLVAERIQSQILAEMGNLDARIAGIEDKVLRADAGKALDKARSKARSGSTISYLLSQRGLDSMLRELRALDGVACAVEEFDQHPHLLPVKNGVLNLETGALQPHGPATHDLLLMRHVDIDYIPDARCPRWEKFLEEIFEDDPSLPGYLQRLVGYGITGFTSEQCFAVFYGTGANGKSVLTDTLSTIFSGITANAAFETFEQQQGSTIRSDIARLNGARLVMTEEGKQGEPMAENTLKLLTGQGAVTTRFLYRPEFEFHPSFLILMSSNYKPNFRGQDEGIWRRVRLIPFTRYFAPASRDRYLAQKFTGQVVPRTAWKDDEDYGDGAAGILAWAVRGAHEWFERGLQDPETVLIATEQYRRTQDALGPFIAEHLIRDDKGRVTVKVAWDAYLKWTDAEGFQRKDIWKRTTFITAMEERGARRTRSGGQDWLSGYRVPSHRELHPAEASDTEPIY